MYWSRTGSLGDLFLWLVISLLSWAGGWLVCASLFRLRSREQLFSGLATGLMMLTLFGNIFAQIMPITATYWVSAGSILIGGLTIALFGQRLNSAKPAFRFDFKQVFDWKTIAVFGSLFLLFLAINRGLGLFDDYSNLALVSTIAAGDVPPHFYLNPEQITYYHYGLHILAAGLVRVGGFFPWSAFDIYKALSIALTITLGGLWLRRWISWQAALLWAGGLILFAGGTRWLLLFIPETVLSNMSADIHMIGSGIQNAPDLYTALLGPWHAQGEGPIPFPFAFVNGINTPLSMALGGGAAMYHAGLFLLLLLARRKWKPLQGLVFGLLIAVQALYSETMFALIFGGITAMALIALVRSILLRAKGSLDGSPVSASILSWGWCLAPSLLLVPVMGGNLSAPLQQMIARVLGDASQGLVTVPTIGLRWPPAVLSAHLGELSLTNPAHLVVALAEIGPMLFLAPIAIWATRGYFRSGKLLLAGLSLMAGISFIAPLLIQFVGRDRDITRLMGSALWIWLILAVPYLWLTLTQGRNRTSSGMAKKAAVCAFYSVTVFSGVALFSVQLTAMPQTQPSYFIQDVDAWMSREYWNQLEPGDWMLDPVHPYRPATVFGRTAGPAYQDFHIPYPEFVALTRNLNAIEISKAGYSYLYLDRRTWQNLTPEQKQSIQNSCAHLTSEKKNEFGDFRRLYDISRCKNHP